MLPASKIDQPKSVNRFGLFESNFEDNQSAFRKNETKLQTTQHNA